MSQVFFLTFTSCYEY